MKKVRYSVSEKSVKEIALGLDELCSKERLFHAEMNEYTVEWTEEIEALLQKGKEEGFISDFVMIPDESQ